MSLAAFLLCAGYGRRLQPLTDRLAKPAIPFLGRSALEINRRAVEALKPDRWLVNAHHLPEQIESLAGVLGLETLYELELLGTGGCLANAAPILNRYDHFLVHNADLIHGIDLQAVWLSHLASGAVATLAGIRRSRQDTLSVDSEGGLLGVHGYRDYEAKRESDRRTFAGIAFYRREFLDFLSPGCEDIKPFWMRALTAGRRIHVRDCSGAAWHDFGTPQGLWDAAKYHMEQEKTFSYHYVSGRDAKPFVSNEARQPGLPEGLRHVLVYENRRDVSAETHNRILGRDFEWPLEA